LTQEDTSLFGQGKMTPSRCYDIGPKVFDRFEILSILKICCQQRSESLKDEKKQKIVPLGSIKAKGRSSKSCLSQVFNFKFGCFAAVKETFGVRTRSRLELINRTSFVLLSEVFPWF